jgi:ferredoxin
MARDGAVSRCDLVIDLTGGAPLFPAHEPAPATSAPIRATRRRWRDGAPAAQMTGTFDKPKYIDFVPDLCAHSRNTITGCTRCLDLCPTGAIEPAGDSVAIDPASARAAGNAPPPAPRGLRPMPCRWWPNAGATPARGPAGMACGGGRRRR